MDQWIEKLGKWEGTREHDAEEKPGVRVRPYGITEIEKKKDFITYLENLDLDYNEMNPKDLAAKLTEFNIIKIKEIIGENKWFSLPLSMQMLASDIYWNAGQLFNNFKKGLIKADYEFALNNILGIFSSYDPKAKKKAVFVGLINRRVDWYNFVAEDLDFKTITDYSVEKSKEKGKKTVIIYEYSDGTSHIINTKLDLHSRSKYRKK
jgi:hypothetical protein